jgi:hypothetical protein
LRETAEEVGLDRHQVEVVCTLPEFHTNFSRGLMTVTPVLAITTCTPEELCLSPNPAEVDCLYWVPLELFLTCNINPGQARGITISYADPETNRTHIIYGLTAAVCVTIAAIALNTLPNFKFPPQYLSEVVYGKVALTQQQAPHSKL